MQVIIAFAIAAIFINSFYDVAPPPKNKINIAVGASLETLSIRHNVRPFSEFKNDNVVKQAYDYSCGSAALATILKFYLGEDFSETQVINGLLRYGNTKLIIKRRGFSLLDIKKFVNILGYKGIGYIAEIDDLKTLDKPCLIPVNLYGFRHFVVFRGIYKDHIFLADPSKGNISFTLNKFKDIWYKNVAFVIYPKWGEGMDALKLKEKDLQIIETDMQRGFICSDIPEGFIPPEKRMLETFNKNIQFYKSK